MHHHNISRLPSELPSNLIRAVRQEETVLEMHSTRPGMYRFHSFPTSNTHPSLIIKTGLCVYEVDDPAIRDDPNVDEVTKLRNRIAELESLVRELRGIYHHSFSFLLSHPSSIKGNPTLAGSTMVPIRPPPQTAMIYQRSGTLAHSRNLLALARNSSPSRPSPSIHPTTSAHTVAPECMRTLRIPVTTRLPHPFPWTVLPPQLIPTLTTPSIRTMPPPQLDSRVAVCQTLPSLHRCRTSPGRCIPHMDSSIALLNTTPRDVLLLIA